ncbi:MAG: FG-GAP repeat protein, partial [Dehalococcoidia bacterium]
MSRIRQFLSYSLIIVLGAAPLQAQTIRSTGERGATMAGFGTAIVIGDGEILVSRTGVAMMLPLLPSRTGGVHVFRPDAGTGVWEEVAHLTASDGDVGDRFGNAMAVDGNTLIVGAPGKDEGRGAVYLFHRDGSGDWSQAGVLSAGDGVTGDSLGAALSLNGDVALIGAPRHAEGAGAVYVFRRGNAGWSQQAKLAGSNAQPKGRFGVALSFDGDRALIGAAGQDSVTGGAYVFRYEGGAWTEKATFRPSDVGPRAAFGARLALDGDNA